MWLHLPSALIGVIVSAGGVDAVIVSALTLVLIPAASGGRAAASVVPCAAFGIYGWPWRSTTSTHSASGSPSYPRHCLGRARATCRFVCYGVIPLGSLERRLSGGARSSSVRPWRSSSPSWSRPRSALRSPASGGPRPAYLLRSATPDSTVVCRLRMALRVVPVDGPPTLDEEAVGTAVLCFERIPPEFINAIDPTRVGGREILPGDGHEPPRWWTREVPTGGQ
jgi:hypothetical protein